MASCYLTKGFHKEENLTRWKFTKDLFSRTGNNIGENREGKEEDPVRY
jgi:hypothetical protein